MIRIVIAFFLIVEALAQSPKYGPCPQVPSEYVDRNRMIGKWFGYARSSNTKDEAERCPVLNWIQPGDGRLLYVFSDISTLINDNSTVVVEVLEMNNNSIYLEMHIPLLEVVRKHHYILETDYNNYDIAYECIEQGSYHTSKAWVVTRSLQPMEGLDNIIDNAFRKRGIAPLSMAKINRKICLEK